MLLIEATPESTEAFVTRSELARRGWAPSMIRDLLDPPDQVRPNPVIRTRAPMRMYRLSRVAAVEKGEAFRTRGEAAAEQRARSAARLARGREAALALAREAVLDLPEHPPERLTALAVEHERSRPLDEARLHRWQVDYLRSRLPRPEELLAVLDGRPGKREALGLLRRRVAEAIGAAYPWLAREAARGLRERTSS
ncbi:hypothetical protein [Actinorhabdospora filicis]|uniref:hypothetical protein n=1 Tax=Actinorhabdospora filicis TaxID=1785913 RepID=UPI002554E68C|nr:hypothetical protein [Actinorhabdospora filicis]